MEISKLGRDQLAHMMESCCDEKVWEAGEGNLLRVEVEPPQETVS